MSRCNIVLLLLGSHMEVATFCCSIHHASLAIEVATRLFLLYSSVSVEFGRELDLSFDLLAFALKGLCGELDAEFVLSCLLRLILVLHVGVHIAIKELVFL